MKNKLIGLCPICGKKLIASELTCTDCDTKIQGEFSLSKFDYLTTAQQEFALVFLKNAGNIKSIEKELNISYPTVKKTLDELIVALGFKTISILPEDKWAKEDILRALREKEITFDEAERMLKECGE